MSDPELHAWVGILEAADPRAWDLRTDELVDCLGRLATLGVSLCAMHIPVPVGGIHQTAILQQRIPHVLGGTNRQAIRNGNKSGMWVPGWAYWLLHGSQPWTFKHLASCFPSLISDRQLDAMPRPLKAALRLGGSCAVDAMLRQLRVCACSTSTGR